MAGVEIKTFVVVDASGRVVGVRLNKQSATQLFREHPGGHIEPHLAHKRMEPDNEGTATKQGSDLNHATVRREPHRGLRAAAGN